MTREELCSLIGELRRAPDDVRNAYVNGIISALSILSDNEWQKIPSVKSFIKRLSFPKSQLDNVDADLKAMHDELCVAVVDKQQQIKSTAVGEMRRKRKGPIIIAIVILIAVALLALTCGVMSAIRIISEVWCNVIGVFDCVFGISFFAYELYDDKLKSSAIDNGDVGTIGKYYMSGNKIKTGKARSKNGVANSGFVFGNINNGVSCEELRKIMSFERFGD